MVGVDEVVGVDDDDGGDELVLDEMKEVDGRRGSGEQAATAPKESGGSDQMVAAAS